MHLLRSYRPSLTRVAVLAVAALSLAALGCPKQEDLPAAPEFVAPPTPTDLVVTLLDAQLNPPEYDYNFTWTVSDPSQVDHYRIYLLGGGFVPDELLFETPNTTYDATFGFSLTGLQFAVSAVSPEGIEGNGRVTLVQ
ncbi:MAG: hypothetical protein L0Z51_11580 [Candidatus Latescibacteria bacterium]|nr:hypothetical protein [Candidatus Latescibacterota bacterium]